jgi:hypothetical protein
MQSKRLATNEMRIALVHELAAAGGTAAGRHDAEQRRGRRAD